MSDSASRVRVFQSLREKLEDSATKGYNEFQRVCLLVSEQIGVEFSDPPFLQDYSALHLLKRDKYSTKFLPKSLSHVIPLWCTGDGNCLFRYV